MKQRIKKAVCLLLAGLTLVLAGCVKTPEGMAVAAKTKIDGFHLGEVLNEDGTPKAQELGEPKHITESWTQALGGSADGGGTEQRLDYTIKIDADVTVPEDGIFPVYGVAKAKYMDEDVFDRFVNVLFEGCEGKYSAPTGSQYKKGCFDSDEWAVASPCYDGEINYEHCLEVYQGQGSILIDEDHSMMEHLVFYIRTELHPEEGEVKSIGIYDWDGYNSSRVIGLPQYVFDYYEDGQNAGSEEEPVVTELIRNETSEEDALKLAEDFLAKVGLSDSMTLGWSGRTRFLGKDYNEVYEAMGFAFVPKVGNTRMAPVDADDTVDTADLNLRNFESSMSFDALWKPNVLKLYVSNGSIFHICWVSCTNDNNSGVISRNAPLMPFSEIYEVFKNKLDIMGNYPLISVKAAVPKERTVCVNNIELCYYRVKAGTGAEDYALIPVWVFMGDIELKYDPEDYNDFIHAEDGTVIKGGAGYCIMMINAIDGSVIDLSRGY